MKKLFVLALVISGCVASTYAKDLDACLINNAPDHKAVVDCQCQVSQANGRSCDWLGAKDAGVQ